MAVYVLLSLLAALSSWVSVVTIPLDTAFATADTQNNFYAVDRHHTLLKLDSLGNELYRFRRGAGGALTHVDPTNPFKPLLYYAPSMTVVVTDNTLATAAELSLATFGFTQVPAVCRSSDEGLWIFDAADFKLKKLDVNGTLMLEGADLLQHAGFAPDVRFMVEHDQKIYLSDSSRGVLVTDAYGNYEKTLAITGLPRFQFVNNRLLYFSNGAMVFYDLRIAVSDTLPLSGVEPFHQAVYSRDRLLTHGQNGLSLYRKTSP